MTTGAFQTTYGGSSDIGIHKYSSNGSTLLYARYYGGNGLEYANSTIVNSAGELILAGVTRSTNLPVSSNCFDGTLNGTSDLFVAHLNASGTALVGASYLGGSGQEGDVSIGGGLRTNRGEVLLDAAGDILVAFGTTSTDFPTTFGALQRTLSGNVDAFISKFNPTCSNLMLSTYLGGSGDDLANCIHYSKSGKIVVGGTTGSTNFLGTAGGWQSVPQGDNDGFIAVLNPQLSSLLAATYNATTGNDEVAKVQVDNAFNVYATGINRGAFPVSAGVYSLANGKNYMVKLDSSLGTRLVSTTFGTTTSAVLPTGFLVDKCSNLYFIGYDAVSGMATTPDAFAQTTRGFWTCALAPDMRSLLFASYLGSPTDRSQGGTNRFDSSGILYIATCTRGTTLPTSSSVHAPSKLTFGDDMASWKVAYQLAYMQAGFTINRDSFCIPATVQLTNTSHGALTTLWDFGDGSRSTLFDPGTHVYTKSGQYTIRQFTYNSASCKPIDSQVRSIRVFDTGDVRLFAPPKLVLCNNDSTRMTVRLNWVVEVSPAVGVRYQSSGGNEIVFNPDTTTTYTVRASADAYCIAKYRDSIRFTIIRDTTTVGHIEPWPDTALCKGDTATFYLSRKLNQFAITPPSFSSVGPDSLSVRFFPPATTEYQFVGMNRNMCTTIRDTFRFRIDRSSVAAAFEPNPRLTDTELPDFRFWNRSRNAISYEWQIDGQFWSTGTSPTFTAVDTGTYQVVLTATDAFNCVDSARDSVRMIKSRIYMLNAFTPNNDGLNDIFRPIILNVEIDVFAVYNRYGQRIFVTSKEGEGWDGTFNGKRCDLGTYFYLVEYHTLTREPAMLKGDVTLVR